MTNLQHIAKITNAVNHLVAVLEVRQNNIPTGSVSAEINKSDLETAKTAQESLKVLTRSELNNS